LFALVLILFLVLVPEAYYGVYLIFGRADFTHARLSILALLPLCSLFAIYLAELKSLPFGGTVHGLARSARRPPALSILFVAAFLSWLIHGPVIDQLVPKTAFQFGVYRPNAIVMPPVAVKVVLTTIILAAVLTGLLWKPRPSFNVRVAVTIVVSTFAFVENGYLRAFQSGWPAHLEPPGPLLDVQLYECAEIRDAAAGEEKLKAFAEKLETADFRSVC